MTKWAIDGGLKPFLVPLNQFQPLNVKNSTIKTGRFFFKGKGSLVFSPILWPEFVCEIFMF